MIILAVFSIAQKSKTINIKEIKLPERRDFTTYPHLPYAITELFCAIFSLTIWIRLNINIGSEHEIKQLRNMIYSYIGMLFTDIIWALTEDSLTTPNQILYAFINAITIISITLGCYFWFKFIEDRVHFTFASKKIVNVILVIPLMIICILDIISVFTGWIFYIDEKLHYCTTSFFTLQIIVDYFYLIVPTVFTIYSAIKTRSKQEKSEYLTYALYMLAPLISGFLEDYFPFVPILALNIFMMILILFLMIQNMHIYNDALTGLNNRKRLNQYMEDRFSKASLSHPVLFFIIDINGFKRINDIYGHLEGDNALKTFSGVIKKFASKHDAFVARYGGDEFCMVIDTGVNSPEKIIDDLSQSLQYSQRVEKIGETEYTLTFSAGFAICDKANTSINSILEKADEMLYVNKQKLHNDY